MTFFARCLPPKTTSQMKRAARTANGIRFFKSKDQVAAANTLEAILLPHQPAKPVEGIVCLLVEVTWPWRKSDIDTKAKRAYAERVGRIPCGTKPDADNFVKALQDTLVSLRFIERDELVCDLTVRKFFGGDPGIYISVTTPEIAAVAGNTEELSNAVLIGGPSLLRMADDESEVKG